MPDQNLSSNASASRLHGTQYPRALDNDGPRGDRKPNQDQHNNFYE